LPGRVGGDWVNNSIGYALSCSFGNQTVANLKPTSALWSIVKSIDSFTKTVGCAGAIAGGTSIELSLR